MQRTPKAFGARGLAASIHHLHEISRSTCSDPLRHRPSLILFSSDRMHANLTPKNNVRLIAISVIVLALVIVFGSVPFPLYAIGAVFGAVGGFLQLRAIRQSHAGFLSADSALAVRRALASSASGKIYLILFWVGAVVFITISIILLRERFVFGWLAAYFCFVVVRDLIALPATYELERRASLPDQTRGAI
jgi:hypothetical protein